MIKDPVEVVTPVYNPLKYEYRVGVSEVSSSGLITHYLSSDQREGLFTDVTNRVSEYLYEDTHEDPHKNFHLMTMNLNGVKVILGNDYLEFIPVMLSIGNGLYIARGDVTLHRNGDVVDLEEGNCVFDLNPGVYHLLAKTTVILVAVLVK